MKDFFYRDLYFFYTKVSRISRFTFQFLTFNKPKESIFYYVCQVFCTWV